jgi:uncharacterized MAPEG superfamily protein
MSAVSVMLLAIGSGVLGRWAHNKDAVPSATGVVEIVFALVVISALDQGRTADIAKGFAWLFLVAVLLGNNSPLTGLAKLEQRKVK